LIPSFANFLFVDFPHSGKLVYSDISATTLTGGSDRLRLQPRTLWKASLENPASIGSSTQRTMPTFKAPMINLYPRLIFIGALLHR
jgi:hypothetical protein